MKHSRFMVLNLYVPVGVAIYVGVGRALPTLTINTLKTFIIYACCATTIYFVAHLATQFAYHKLIKDKAHPQLSLIIGGIVAVLFAFFFLRAFYELVWQWFPWLASGFRFKLEESTSGFWSYLLSSTGLLFVPTWYLVNAAYEYAGGERMFFPLPPDGRDARVRVVETSHSLTRPLLETGLLSKLPQMTHPDIIALEAQQHYVRIHLTTGSEMVLYRFGDAVREFEARGLGRQVHRSFLVMDDAVLSMHRKGRSLFLRLRGGLDVPVSQSYRGSVARYADRIVKKETTSINVSTAHS